MTDNPKSGGPGANGSGPKGNGSAFVGTIVRAAIGTFVGGCIGTILLPGVGTAFGAKLGAVLAGMGGHDPGNGDIGSASGFDIG